MRKIHYARGGELCAIQHDHPESDDTCAHGTVVADFVVQQPDGSWKITHTGHVRHRDLHESGFILQD